MPVWTVVGLSSGRAGQSWTRLGLPRSDMDTTTPHSRHPDAPQPKVGILRPHGFSAVLKRWRPGASQNPALAIGMPSSAALGLDWA
eukprot:5315554-Pyramimonas_sp.AAC.1